jgi:hypothetical protein
VLGTLGTLGRLLGLDGSLLLRRRFSPLGFEDSALDSAFDDCEGVEVSWPVGIFLGESFGLEGLDEE